MRQVSQTYFLTCTCYERRSRFQVHANAQIALDTLRLYSAQGQYELHAAVIMPDHIHAMFTPAMDKSIEACVSLIKGGISFRLRSSFAGQLWQDHYNDVRIRDEDQFLRVMDYIRRNPERRGLRSWPFVFVQASASEAKASL